LDHAGATVYSTQQLRLCVNDLTTHLYANPHSLSPASERTTDIVDQVRETILRFFNTSSRTYSVIFTSGSTAALKLVGETFPWTKDSQFIYTVDNHTSVLGIREYARKAGAVYTTVDNEFNIMYSSRGSAPTQSNTSSTKRKTYHLFAFPAESNFSGRKFNLQWIHRYHQHGDTRRRLAAKCACSLNGSVGVKSSLRTHTHTERKCDNIPTPISTGTSSCYMVLVDASKFAATSHLDLSKYPADFVTLSFYKMFGYPTGIGALLVRNDAATVLQKTFFGGGTIQAAVSSGSFRSLRKGVSERFEDGTVSFLSIASLRYGFQILNRLTMKSIQNHVSALTHHLYLRMRSLRYSNGQHLCTMYSDYLNTYSSETGDSSPSLSSFSENQGSVLSFNLHYASGKFIGYSDVAKLAASASIHLRTGCFCNPGACQVHLKLSNKEVKENLEQGHVCWDGKDIMNGKPTGCVRISVGYMTIFQDIQIWLKFLRLYFLDKSVDSAMHNKSQIPAGPVHLSRILLYPIKSCAGMNVMSWPVCPSGLLYDREWVIVAYKGKALTLRNAPKLCLIRPMISLRARTLTISAPKMKPFTISLNSFPSSDDESTVRVCGAKCKVNIYGRKVAAWFTKFLGRECNLAHRSRGFTRIPRKRTKLLSPSQSEQPQSSIVFSNEGQFLMVSESSVEALNLQSAKQATHYGKVVDL